MSPCWVSMIGRLTFMAVVTLANLPINSMGAHLRMPTKAPFWYKNFPPWWMGPSAMKDLAKDYTYKLYKPSSGNGNGNTAKSEPGNKGPLEASPYGLLYTKPGGLSPVNGGAPKAAPVGNPVVPDPKTKPITIGNFYGPAVNAQLAGPAGQPKATKIFNDIMAAKGTNLDEPQNWKGTPLGDLRDPSMETKEGSVDGKTPMEEKQEAKGGVDMQAAPGDKKEEDGKAPQLGDNESKEMETEDFTKLSNNDFNGDAPNDHSDPHDQHGTSNGHTMPKSADDKKA